MIFLLHYIFLSTTSPSPLHLAPWTRNCLWTLYFNKGDGRRDRAVDGTSPVCSPWFKPAPQITITTIPWTTTTHHNYHLQNKNTRAKTTQGSSNTGGSAVASGVRAQRPRYHRRRRDSDSCEISIFTSSFIQLTRLDFFVFSIEIKILVDIGHRESCLWMTLHSRVCLSVKKGRPVTIIYKYCWQVSWLKEKQRATINQFVS